MLILFIILDSSKTPLISTLGKSKLEGVAMALSYASVICSFMYYYLYKKYELYIIAIVYLNYISVDIFLKIINFFDLVPLGGEPSYLVLGYCVRTLILLQIPFPIKKIKDLLGTGKIISILTCCGGTILITYFELILHNNYLTSDLIFFVEMVKLFFVSTQFIVILSLIKKISTEETWLFGLIAISLNALTLKRLCVLNSLYGNSVNTDLFVTILNIIGFGVISLGVFLDLIFKVKRENKIKDELEIFYNITDMHENSNILILDEENNIIYKNRRCRHMTESGLRFDKISEPCNCTCKSGEISEEIKEIINRQNYYKGDYYSGDNRVYDLYIQTLKTSTKEKLFACILTDVTEDRRKNLKLITNERKLSTINRNIKDFIFMVDTFGNITYLNPHAIKTLGYSLKEFIGQPFLNYVKECSDGDKLVYKGRELIQDIELICKNGRRIHIEAIETEILEGEGNNGTIIVGRDLSKRDDYDRLKVKYDEIKAYDKIREEFFANLSHEVRTPINVIYSSIQLLEHNRKRGEEDFMVCYDRYEENIKLNCFRLLRLVNNILSLSTINSGVLMNKEKNVEIVSFLEEVTQSVIPFVESKNITIMFDTEVEEHFIKCDVDNIEKVLLNLLSNAVKFTKEGGNILVECFVNENWFEFRVKDDGIGIPHEMREVIFQRFTQLDKSLNRENEGSGIGLALAKSLVELHNGEIILEEGDKGASFIVRLPNILLEEEELLSTSEKKCSRISDRVLIELSDIYD